MPLIKDPDRLVIRPEGKGLVSELSRDLKPIRHYYLGDAEEVARATSAVAEQSSPK